MAGICGIYTPSNIFDSKKLLLKMLNKIEHRGEHKKLFVTKKVGIGYVGNRKVIKEIEENLTKYDILCVYDGTFFNNVTPRDIIKRFTAKGIQGLKNLEGDFSLIMYLPSNKLIVMTSLSNQRNIYYTYYDNLFYFSSELKSLLLSGVPRDIDFSAINFFLSTMHVLSPLTFFKFIKRLPFASILEISPKSLHCYHYWLPPTHIKIRNEKEALQKLFDCLILSTEKRIKAYNCNKENSAVLLSGGIDSTSLVYFVNQFVKNPTAYTLFLKEEGKYARLASSFFDLNHNEIFISSEEFFKYFPLTNWYFELHQPLQVFYSFLLMKDRKKTLFWADSAEEVFFGKIDYPLFYFLNYVRKFVRLPNSLVNLSSSLCPKYWMRRGIKLLNGDFFKFYLDYGDRFIEKEKLFTNFLLSNDPLKEMRKYFNFLNYDFLHNYAFTDLIVWFFSHPMPDLGPSLTNPFIDKNVLNVSFSISPELKIKFMTPRYLEKKMMSGKIPSETIFKKWNSWESQQNWVLEQKDFIINMIENLKKRGILKPEIKNIGKFLELVTNRFNQKGPIGDIFQIKAMQLFTLEIFLQNFVDNINLKKPKKLSL